MKRCIPFAFFLVLAAWGARPADAQQRTPFRFEEEIIRGEVQKPEVMMVITRQNLNSSYTLELRESFLPLIVESVESKPF